jgi:antitoxin (DNA-binding transcriptional repressor) of toxin-antitoxin stability system
MITVNIHEAKSNLSRLLSAIESGAESEIIIARNGKPIGRLTSAAPPTVQKVRFGLAKGKYVIPDDIDALNPEIEKLFYGEDD